MFIVFEGGDGCGKSTQADLLKSYFDSKDIPCILLKCPDRSSITGSFISSYLRGDHSSVNHQVINCVLAANIWEVADAARQALEQGQVVIMDRYKYSHFAYSMARGGTWEQVSSALEGVETPDLVVFLDIDPEEALKRKTGPLEVLETIEFQTNVHKHYKESIVQPDWIVLDARATSPCIIHQKIVHILESKVKVN